MGLEDYVTHTTIKVSKDIKQKLLVLKYKYMFKSFDDLLKFMLDIFEKYEKEKEREKRQRIEERVREMIVETCLDLGEEGSFYPKYIIRRYKIQEKEIVEYLLSQEEKQIECKQILKDESK
ncbi:MAG: hypothetical protein QXV17_14610 [Candidatus Micrarchaeaceae archaeon]